MKTCFRCGQERPASLENFSKEARNKDGLSGVCRPCQRIEAVNRKHGRHAPKRQFAADGKTACTNCGEFKPQTVEHFAPNAKCRGGLEPECRECRTKKRHARKPPKTMPPPLLEGHIWCKGCQQHKPATADHFGPHKLGWKKAICRECRNAANRVRPVPEVGCKICGDCGRQFPATLEFFPPKPTGALGIAGTCRSCHAPKMRRYYQENRTHLVAMSAEWARRNPERARANFHNYRARKRAAPGRHSAADIKAQFEAQDGKCYWCLTPLVIVNGRRYHVDHFIPLSRGGGNGPDNIVCACASCNGSKHNKMPWEFRPDRFTPPA